MNGFLDYFRAGLARASSGLPRGLARKLYDWPLGQLRSHLDLGPEQIWVRNSLALDYWELGLSDIDLSIWVEGDVYACVAVWQKLQPHLPLLIGGEVHIYSAPLVRALLPMANPWELRRDPGLLQKTRFTPNFVRPSAATVFLARMLQADRRLRHDPTNRQRKWRDHLRALDLPVPALITWSGLVDLLHQRAPFQHFSRAELEHELSYEGPHDHYQAGVLGRILRANHHIWGDIVRTDDEVALAQMSDDAHGYLADMVAWEIWGISPLTQIICGYDPDLLKGFWGIQRWLIQHLRISAERRHELSLGFDALERFYAPLTSNT